MIPTSFTARQQGKTALCQEKTEGALLPLGRGKYTLSTGVNVRVSYLEARFAASAVFPAAQQQKCQQQQEEQEEWEQPQEAGRGTI